MKITTETATYLYLITTAIDNGKLEGPFTTVCPECGDDTGPEIHYVVNDEDPHIVVGLTSDVTALIIGCEGYHLFEVRADGTVAAKPDTDDALGDEVTGVHAGSCAGTHGIDEGCTPWSA